MRIMHCAMGLVVVLFCLAGVNVVNAKSLDIPPYLTACAYNDPDLNACAVKGANKAIPIFIKGDKKYRVPSMDPLVITSLRMNEGVLGLKMSAHNVKLFGLKDAHVDSAEIDLQRKSARFNFTLPRIEVDMHYEVSGRILILPITGSGPGNATFTNLKTSYAFEWELVKKKDGKEYAVLKDGQYDFNISRMYLHLENLFNGNKLLGDQMNIFMNENWRDLVKDLGPVIGEVISATASRIISNFFNLLSYDKIFPTES